MGGNLYFANIEFKYMTIKELLNKGIDILKSRNIEDANLIAKILLAHLLKVDKSYLVIHDNLEMSQKVEKEYLQIIDILINGKPLQYITNNQEFMKLDFFVDENVLIPRADTEILVEEVLKFTNQNTKLLDLCTGSGAIGISIAIYNENARIYLSDVSKKALNIAEKNVIKHEVENRVKLIHSNMFENIQEKDFDIIVSNPPYIETETINKLDKNVLNEPHLALDGGKDGLDFYRIIINNSKNYIKKGGYLALEIGYNQRESVCNLLKQEKVYEEIYCKKDLGGNDRVIVAKRR